MVGVAVLVVNLAMMTIMVVMVIEMAIITKRVVAKVVMVMLTFANGLLVEKMLRFGQCIAH